LLIALNQLQQRTREALGVGIAEHDAVGEFEHHLRLPILSRARHVKTKIDDNFLGRLVDEIAVGVRGAQVTVIDDELNVLTVAGGGSGCFFGHGWFPFKGVDSFGESILAESTLLADVAHNNNCASTTGNRNGGRLC